MSKIKVILTYNESDDKALHKTFKTQLPKQWLKATSDKLRDYFLGEYNKAFKENQLTKDEHHLQLKNGTQLPHDGKLADYIESGDTLYVKKGKGPVLKKVDSDDDEEVVPINKKKNTQPKKSASAPRAPYAGSTSAAATASGDADFSKIKLRVMDVEHPSGSTTPPVPVGSKKRFHTTYSDGVEQVEEYDAGSGELLMRKWRSQSLLGGDGKWEFEIGEEAKPPEAGGGFMMASSSNPSFHCRDTEGAWEWRVRNMPYKQDVYSVTVDAETQSLVLRTSNKKYFKKFTVAGLRRAGLFLEKSAISFEHSNNTLIIQYEKPDNVLAREQILRIERNKGHARKF